MSSSPVRSSVCPSVRLLPILWTRYLQTNKPMLLQIGISGPWGKHVKRSTLGSGGQRSKVKVTGGWSLAEASVSIPLDRLGFLVLNVHNNGFCHFDHVLCCSCQWLSQVASECLLGVAVVNVTSSTVDSWRWSEIVRVSVSDCSQGPSR